MKAFTLAELQSQLDSEMVWRRREMTSIVTLLPNVDLAARQVLIRAAIPLLYAHWEGYAKACGLKYLEFVSYRSKHFKDLRTSFLYLASFTALSQFSNKPVNHAIETIEALIKQNSAVHRDPFRRKITTRSNLRYEVLVEILTLCGIETTEFEEHKTFIDKDLCDSRNEIAHGAGGSPPMNILVQRRDRTFEVMDLLKNTVLNAAVTEAYLKS